MIIYRGTKSPCFFDMYQNLIHNKKSLEFWQKIFFEYTICKEFIFFIIAMKKEHYFSHLLRCMKKPYCCLCTHVKTYKRTYALGIFWSFAIVKLILLAGSVLGTLYHEQYHATAAWPAPVDPSTFCSTNLPVVWVSFKECVGVVDIYNNTDGQNRTHTNNRLTSTNIGTRYGITTSAGHVTEINLSNNNLTWSIPLNIRELSYMTTMNISHNAISRIATLSPGYLTSVVNFNASYNILGDTNWLDAIYNLPSIQTVDFSHNQMTQIPKWYNQIADTVTYLNLSYNTIRDITPVTEPWSKILIRLYFQHNRIEKIPETIAYFASIQFLDLSKNLISNITPIWNLAPSLIYLNLAHNFISSIPSSFSNFEKMPGLLSLNLSYNTLTKRDYIANIPSLWTLNLSNNQLRDMIPLSNLKNLQSLDYGFNRLEKFPDINNLLSVAGTLTNLSLRHNLIHDTLPKDFFLLNNLTNWGSQIDYNRLDLNSVTDPNLIAFLDAKFNKDGNTEEDLNTKRRNQYRNIETVISANLDTPTATYYPWDEIPITITIENKWIYDTHDLDVSLYDNPGVFTIQNPTDGYRMIKERIFDYNDPCKVALENATWPYKYALDVRALNNGRSSFFTYLLSPERDYDMYAVRGNDPSRIDTPDPYPTSRWGNFIKWIEGYKYDMFNVFSRTFPSLMDNWLFYKDLNDFANPIDNCGIGGSDVISFDEPSLSTSSSRNIPITIKIDSDYTWTFTLKSLLESDNRLYRETNISDNTYDLSITIKDLPLDTDDDGIYDNEDNCVYVANPGQEDSVIVSWSTVTFTKADYADETNPANQDCINWDVCLTRSRRRPLYNAVSQTSGDVYAESCDANPAGTERATGSCSDKDWLIFDKLFIVNDCYPTEMTGYNLCLHTISDDKYYDVSFSSWTAWWLGWWFSYTRTEYRDPLGDACDCTDTLCTTGYDYTGNLICTPVDPACPISACNNNIIEGSELCDGTDLAGEDCISQGFDGGSLACNTACDAFDTTACTTIPPVTPSDCAWTPVEYCSDVPTWSWCSNYYSTITEKQCEAYLVGKDPPPNCIDGDSCVIPVSDPCGNGTIDSGELCDTTNLNGESCISQGFDGGSLACNTACDAFDTTACTTITPPVCGNGIIEGNEPCDSTNLNGHLCSEYWYILGTLSCTASCTIDSRNCSNPHSWGGGGWGGLTTDKCPGGDLSPSYYDGTCAAPATHTVAPTTKDTDTPITRKVMAQLVSAFAQEILWLIPDPTRPCEFADIGHLSASEQKSITDACMLNIMGVHKNGVAIKINFEPGKHIDEKEFATALSRTIYDGTYNLRLDSPIARYTNHVTQIKKIGLLPSGPRVMFSFAIKAFDTIKNDLTLVKRSDTHIHAAASTKPATSSTGNAKTGTNVITSPATSVSNSLRLMFQDLKEFFILKPYEWRTTTETNEEETHAAAETTTTPTTTELIKFMQFFR